MTREKLTSERVVAAVVDKLATVYSYADFKKRRDEKEAEKKKIIDLVQFLHNKHKPGGAA